MNPLASRLEKQPRLIEEDKEDGPLRRRPFSNCMLFVLMAVFVFALACFAVYTAVAMGVSVEKNQAAPAKPEALSTEGPILADLSNAIKLPDDNNDTEPVNPLSDPFNQRFRIRIFIKGKDDTENNKEVLDPEQNKTDAALFSGVPRARITFGKLIIRNLDKPDEVNSSEDVSTGSDETVKDLMGLNPNEKSDAPILPSVFFNLFKFPEDPIEHFFNLLSDVKKQQPNFIRMEQRTNLINEPNNSESQKSSEEQTFDEKKSEQKVDEEQGTAQEQKAPEAKKAEDVSVTPEEPKVPEVQKLPEKENNQEKAAPESFKELLSLLEKPKEEPKTVTPEEQEKPMKYQQQGRSPTESRHAHYNPIDDLFSTVDHFISNVDHGHHRREHESERPVTHVYSRPSYIRFYKFNPHMVNSDMYSPMHQRMSYGDRNQYYQDNMMRLPLSPMPAAESRGYHNGQHTRMYDATSTRPPTTYTTRYTTTPSHHYTHSPREQTTYRGERREVPEEKAKQATESPLKYNTNQINTDSQNRDQSSMIDRIDTENVEPFENFLNSRFKV